MPTHILDLADADSDQETERAANEATRYLADPKNDLEVRYAAAKVLGRLRRPAPPAIDRLGAVLVSEHEDPTLRAFSAWALGEMRSQGSLAKLTEALSVPLDARTGQHVLDGLAKHYALLSREPDRLVGLVEAMVRFAGNQRERPGPIYDVLSTATRTLPVDVRVLERAVDTVSSTPDGARKARDLGAMYDAAYELLDRVDRSRGEIAAGEAAWRTEVEAALREAQRAFEVEDPHTALLLVWYLGRLTEIRPVASIAADVLAGSAGDRKKRPSVSRSPRLRLIAAWTLARLELEAPGPRRALVQDILPREIERVVLELLGELSSRPEDLDELQKLLEIEEGARR